MIETGQPIAMSPMPTEARPSARANGPASTTACRRSSRQTRSQADVTMALAAFGERRKIPGRCRGGELAGVREREGDRTLELTDAKRLDQVDRRLEDPRLAARRQDARADDRQIPDPQLQPH